MKKVTQHTAKEPIILGTQEFQAKYTIVPKLRNLWDYHAKVMDGCELDSMLLVNKITTPQYNTLGRFAAILHRAGYATIKSVDLSSPGGQIDQSRAADKKSKQMMRLVKMMTYLDNNAGKRERLNVINMIILDTPIKDINHLNKMVVALDEYFSS